MPVFAAKSYFGNLGAGSGTTELAASLLALKHGVVPADAELRGARSRPARSHVLPSAPGRLRKPYCPEDRLHRHGPVCRGGVPEVGIEPSVSCNSRDYGAGRLEDMP